MSSQRASPRKEEQLDLLFHALADSTRRHIVSILTHGPLSVTELAAPFAISLPAISKHLDVLERAGLVRRERDGRFQRCHLQTEPFDRASEFIEHYRSFWSDTLDQLAEFAEAQEPRTTARGARKQKQP